MDVDFEIAGGSASKQGKRTSRLAKTLTDLTGLLQVNVPALGLASLVLQGESEDGTALLDGILAIGLRRVESLVDGVEGRGGREAICRTCA